VTNFIIDELGGQVVRVGHPKMTPFPAREGFVDLAMLEDRFMLHAFAVTRAQFLVASLSGIRHLGSAVGTPKVMTNCISHPCSAGVWREEDIVLYINIYGTDKRCLSTERQHELGLFGSHDLMRLAKTEGYQFVRNTPQEMNAAVKSMMEATMDCQGWRSPRSRLSAASRPNRFDYPMPPRRKHRIVEFPELAPKTPR
jgi:putative glycosyltransferase (TIGR04372 family)